MEIRVTFRPSPFYLWRRLPCILEHRTSYGYRAVVMARKHYRLLSYPHLIRFGGVPSRCRGLSFSMYAHPCPSILPQPARTT